MARVSSEGNGNFDIRPPNDSQFYIIKGIYVRRTSGTQNLDIDMTDGTDSIEIVHESELHNAANILCTRDWYARVDCDTGINVSITVQVVGNPQQ